MALPLSTDDGGTVSPRGLGAAAEDLAQPVSILLVDDEERNLDVLESILEPPGYRLVRARPRTRP